MSELITNGLTEIMEYELIDSELKQKLIKDPKLAKDIDKWTKKYITNRHAFGIKECNVEYIDYDNLDLDEIEDEVDKNDLIKKIKKNERLCPNHRTCMLFKNNLIVPGAKCILEVADATMLKEALTKELEIQPEDYNDIISVDQLVSINILGNRALRALSSEALIDTTITYTKNGVQYDKKVNDNFTVFEKTQTLGERVRKALVLDRNDKLKLKQLVEGKTKADVEESVKNKISDFEADIDMAEIVDIVQNEHPSDNYADDVKTILRQEREKKNVKKAEQTEITDIEG